MIVMLKVNGAVCKNRTCVSALAMPCNNYYTNTAYFLSE